MRYNLAVTSYNYAVAVDQAKVSPNHHWCIFYTSKFLGTALCLQVALASHCKYCFASSQKAAEFEKDLIHIEYNDGQHQPQPRVHVILAADAKKTNSQMRYERDIRDRITKGESYYSKKRSRNAAYKQGQAAKRSAHQTKLVKCKKCHKPTSDHDLFCIQGPLQLMIENNKLGANEKRRHQEG